MLKEKMLELYTLAEDEGPVVWFLGVPAIIKATSEQTGGAFGLIKYVAPVGFETVYHVHHVEDESFFVLEGELTFRSGDRQIIGRAGSFTFLPRNIPHGFKVTGNKPASFFTLSAPASFERFVLEMSAPTPPAGPPDMEKLRSLAAKYNIEVLGPLPG